MSLDKVLTQLEEQVSEAEIMVDNAQAALNSQDLLKANDYLRRLHQHLENAKELRGRVIMYLVKKHTLEDK
jgi:hypothetical protein